MNKICFVTENPTSEKILDESFPNRYGDYLESLLKRAGISGSDYLVLESNNHLQESDFEVIVTLGKTPTGMLLKLPKTFKMNKYVGQRFGKIIPWYSLEHLFIRGKKLELETIELLGKLK